MSTVSFVDLEQFARTLVADRFGEEEARALARSYLEFAGRRRRPLGPLTLVVDGRSYPSIYAAIAEPEAMFNTGELRLGRAPPASDAWEYLAPFERIVFQDDGSAELVGPGGAPPRRAIARVLVREHHVVGRTAEPSRAGPGAVAPPTPSLFGTLDQTIALCRGLPAVPFELAVLLYLPEERVRYEIDAVHGFLLADPRAGRLSASRRVPRPSRTAWGIDRRLGRSRLPLLAARCLEVLAESNGLTAAELAHIFGGARETLETAASVLVQQRWATFDRRTGLFRARLEAFLPPAEPVASPAAADQAHPELRTSVQELIAAADARATCPLCGRPMPGGPERLLCAECAREVGTA